MVGGTVQAYEKAAAILSAMARKVVYCGDSGTGLAAKIANKCVGSSSLTMHDRS